MESSGHGALCSNLKSRPRFDVDSGGFPIYARPSRPCMSQMLEMLRKISERGYKPERDTSLCHSMQTASSDGAALVR